MKLLLSSGISIAVLIVCALPAAARPGGVSARLDEVITGESVARLPTQRDVRKFLAQTAGLRRDLTAVANERQFGTQPASFELGGSLNRASELHVAQSLLLGERDLKALVKDFPNHPKPAKRRMAMAHIRLVSKRARVELQTFTANALLGASVRTNPSTVFPGDTDLYFTIGSVPTTQVSGAFARPVTGISKAAVFDTDGSFSVIDCRRIGTTGFTCVLPTDKQVSGVLIDIAPARQAGEGSVAVFTYQTTAKSQRQAHLGWSFK